MQRHNFQHDGLNLSYLDTGGADQTLIALHSHWMEGQTFASLAAALAPGWRVIALDQRGHGYSGHASTYMREDYLGDLDVLFVHLGISRAVLLGNSLGGVNAYQFAVRHPDYVRALIVEDIGAVIGDDTSFALSWAGVFKTCQDLEERIGPRFFPISRTRYAQSLAGGVSRSSPGTWCSRRHTLTAITGRTGLPRPVLRS
jgi:esterase